MSATARDGDDLRSALRLATATLAEREQEAHDLRTQNEELLAKVAALQSRIEHMTRRIYGWSSERHHPGQQRIDLALPVIVPDAGVPTPSDAATATPAAADPTSAAADQPVVPTKLRRPREPGSHPGRRRLPDYAEIVAQDLDVPDHERLDEHGQPLPFLGWRISDKWDYRPGSYLIRRFRRAIYGQPFSDAQDRLVAAMPAFLIPRGQMTDAALIHTVVEKFADHLPLYRQVLRAGRGGIQLSRSTLVSHVAAVAGAMEPIVAAISDTVRAASFVHLDDTPIRMLDPGRGHAATARIWVYRSNAASVFRFTTTREGRHPAEFLGDYRGHIVADGYVAHEQLYGLNKATHCACWAHARRKFADIKHRYPFALRLVEEIQRLYQVERDLLGASDVERHRVRHERSKPIIDRIGTCLDQAAIGSLPKADLGNAIDYTRKRWRQLTRFLDHGWLPIDNNPAENALRPWAIGRKNWLFVGSQAGGERAATIATIIENCRMQGIDPYRYLCNTVAALHTGRTDFDALTPQAVAAQFDTGVA
jgi:transposase